MCFIVDKCHVRMTYPFGQICRICFFVNYVPQVGVNNKVGFACSTSFVW